MKKFGLGLLLICSTFVFAQDRPGRGGDGPRPGMRGGLFLPPDLNLTDSQKAQVESIRQNERAKMQELNKQSLTHEQFREQAMAIQRASREQVETILTPEQKAKLAQHRPGRGGPRGEMEHRQGPAPRTQN